MRWAFSQPVGKSSAKFVLVAMADCVNAEGGQMVCWPSYRYIAERTGQDVKTVEAAIKWLREGGFIKDTGKRAGVTGQVAVYLLNTTENGVVTPSAVMQAESGKTPEFGAFDTVGKTPVFPDKTPVFPVKDPQISVETPPKTGYGTRNGTRNGTRKEPGKVEAQAPSMPDVPADLLADWMAVRKAKKAGPLTATAIAGLRREADKAGLTAAQAIAFCCEASWQGFNAGWYADRVKGRTPTTTPASRHSGFAAKNYREGVEADGTFN